MFFAHFKNFVFSPIRVKVYNVEIKLLIGTNIGKFIYRDIYSPFGSVPTFTENLRIAMIFNALPWVLYDYGF